MDIRDAEGPGSYTRPRAYLEALSVDISVDGSFQVTWNDASVTYVSASTVAAWHLS